MQWCSSVAAITPTDLYLSISIRTYHTRDGNCSARRQGGVTSDIHMPSQHDGNDQATSVRCSASRTFREQRQRRCNGFAWTCVCLSVNERERCSLILPQWSQLVWSLLVAAQDDPQSLASMLSGEECQKSWSRGRRRKCG